MQADRECAPAGSCRCCDIGSSGSVGAAPRLSEIWVIATVWRSSARGWTSPVRYVAARPGYGTRSSKDVLRKPNGHQDESSRGSMTNWQPGQLLNRRTADVSVGGIRPVAASADSLSDQPSDACVPSSPSRVERTTANAVGPGLRRRAQQPGRGGGVAAWTTSVSIRSSTRRT